LIFKKIFMKSYFLLLLGSLFVFTASAQSIKTAKPDPAKKIQTVETSCGKCKLGLPGKTCELAVRIGENAYYVDGASIDDFGDAHAHDGFCNAIRKAEVQGEVVNDKFKVTYFKLLPEPKKAEEKKN